MTSPPSQSTLWNTGTPFSVKKSSQAAIWESCQTGGQSRRRYCTTVVKLAVVFPMRNSHFKGGRWRSCVGRWHFILLSSTILAMMGQQLTPNLWNSLLLTSAQSVNIKSSAQLHLSFLKSLLPQNYFLVVQKLSTEAAVLDMLFQSSKSLRIQQLCARLIQTAIKHWLSLASISGLKMEIAFNFFESRNM